jgi:hypothetical protein
MKKLMIGTPMYGGLCSAYYHFSSINLMRMACKEGLEISHQFTTTESLITRARTGIANTFLNSDCTHLLFIDADIGFEPEDVFKLLSHNLEFVCGGYPAKNIDWKHISAAAQRGTPAQLLPTFASPYIYNRLSEQPEDVPAGLIEVKNAGTGFMMISKSVLEKLSGHVPDYINNQFDNHGTRAKEFFSTTIKNDILLSEDHYFCEKWREIGGRIFIDPSIRLKHIGTYVYESSPNHWIS